MISIARLEALPKSVPCGLCPNGNGSNGNEGFDFLYPHLRKKHDVGGEEYKASRNMPESEPLHSRTYALHQSAASSNPDNIAHIRAVSTPGLREKQEAIAALTRQGLYTTGKVAEILGMRQNAVAMAVTHRKLRATVINLAVEQTVEQFCVSRQLPSLPVHVSKIEDIANYVDRTVWIKLRQARMERLRAFLLTPD